MAENEFIYVFDPLCGWCYGFDEHLMRLHKKYGSDFPFTVFSGGMITGEQAGPLRDSADYISEAIPRVEETTGVKFGQPFMDLMEEGSYRMDSEPPSRALKAFKRLGDRKKSLQFAHRIQKLLYKEGKDLNKAETYMPDVEKLGVDPHDFFDFFEEEGIKKKTQEEFEFTRSLGVRGYPTLILRTGNKGAVIARGFMPYKDLVRAVEMVLADVTDN